MNRPVSLWKDNSWWWCWFEGALGRWWVTRIRIQLRCGTARVWRWSSPAVTDPLAFCQTSRHTETYMRMTDTCIYHRYSVNFGRQFWFSLSLYIETRMLNSLSHILVIWVFHSFSLVLVDEKSLHFSQTAVTNIYFCSYFICSIQSKIVINSSLFRPNQLSLWEIWIKDWIWKNLNKFSFFGRDTN